jgi:hypothetical protein
MGGLFRTRRHVDRGACDLVELLPLGPEGSHDQVGDIRAFGGIKGSTTRLTAPAYWKFESSPLQQRVRRTSVRG